MEENSTQKPPEAGPFREVAAAAEEVRLLAADLRELIAQFKALVDRLVSNEKTTGNKT
jgi:methyl-accepting chemotaxis protein